MTPPPRPFRNVALNHWATALIALCSICTAGSLLITDVPPGGVGSGSTQSSDPPSGNGSGRRRGEGGLGSRSGMDKTGRRSQSGCKSGLFAGLFGFSPAAALVPRRRPRVTFIKSLKVSPFETLRRHTAHKSEMKNPRVPGVTFTVVHVVAASCELRLITQKVAGGY